MIDCVSVEYVVLKSSQYGCDNFEYFAHPTSTVISIQNVKEQRYATKMTDYFITGRFLDVKFLKSAERQDCCSWITDLQK